MILLLRVIDERCGIDLPAGTIVVPIEDRLDCSMSKTSTSHSMLNVLSPHSDRIALMTPDGKIVKIRDVSAEIMIDRTNIESNPSRNISDPTRELRILRDGTKVWHKNGLFHRDDGPAIERADGTKQWYKNDLLHRDDGPAIEWSSGTKEWWLNGQRHRDAQP